MILNNLSGARPVSTNCEPDSSFALLTDIENLVLEYNATHSSDDTETIEFRKEDLYEDVICDPQSTKPELNFFENESLTFISNEICTKIVNRICCENCQCTLQADLELKEHNIIKSRGNLSDLTDLTYPSVNFIKIFKKIFEFALKIIP